VITTTMYPATEGYFLSNMVFLKFVTVVCSQHKNVRKIREYRSVFGERNAKKYKVSERFMKKEKGSTRNSFLMTIIWRSFLLSRWKAIFSS